MKNLKSIILNFTERSFQFIVFTQNKILSKIRFWPIFQSSQIEVFSSDQEVEKKTKLSQKVFQKTIRKTQQGGKPEPVLSIETKTPWGVVLKPVIRGRFAASEQQVEKTDIFAFEKTEIKSFKPLNVAFKKVPIQESKAVEKQPELIETAVPTICIESEVRTQCNSTTTQTWLNSD